MKNLMENEMKTYKITENRLVKGMSVVNVAKEDRVLVCSTASVPVCERHGKLLIPTSKTELMVSHLESFGFVKA
jgi:hypothetical protein